MPKIFFDRYLNFFEAAAESALCRGLGQVCVTLLIIFSLCVIMDFLSNYKCRASIAFSLKWLGSLLLFFFVSCDSSYLGLAYSAVDCLILLLFSSDNIFCASFFLFYSSSFKKIHTAIYASILYSYFQFFASACVLDFVCMSSSDITRSFGCLDEILGGYICQTFFISVWAWSYFDYILRCLLRCFISICP